MCGCRCRRLPKRRGACPAMNLADQLYKVAALAHVGVKEIGISLRPLPGRRTGCGSVNARLGDGEGATASLSVGVCQEPARGGTRVPRKARCAFRPRVATSPAVPRCCAAAGFDGFKVMANVGPALYPRRITRADGKSTMCLKAARPSSMLPNGDVPLVFNNTDGAASLPTAARCARCPLLHKVPVLPTLLSVPWRPRMASGPIWAGPRVRLCTKLLSDT